MKYAAILGFGTVGSGVAELLTMNAVEITRSAGEEIVLKRIVDVRDFPDSPYAPLFTKNFDDVEQDTDITLVAETIGGVGAAYEFTKRCLAAGKSVATSNKQLVAEHGPELMQLARENGASYLFEASVGGGIPVLTPIRTCLSSNALEEVCGILNGTTNYILTQMFKNGLSFDTALSQAQELGYAERNPEADVGGHDTCRKLCILCGLCFGRHVLPELVPTEGIRGVTEEDVTLAATQKCEIRLIGRAVRNADGRVAVYVAPHLIPEGTLLSSVEGVTNGIVVRGNAVGQVSFCGPGAGKLATASAVISDFTEAVRFPGGKFSPLWKREGSEALCDSSELETRWFIRGTGMPGEGLRHIGSAGNTDGYLSPRTNEAGIAELTRNMTVMTRFRLLDI